MPNPLKTTPPVGAADKVIHRRQRDRTRAMIFDGTMVDGPLEAMLVRHPELAPATDVVAAYQAIVTSQDRDGCLYLCGNGGSLADALHISGEMLKSYTLPRPLVAGHRPMDGDLRARLVQAGPDGEMLGRVLERGLRAVVLGLNHSLTSALENDVSVPAIGYAQELLVLARPGDALLGISTSGNARNVCYAAQVARALGMTVISLTGEGGGRLAPLADIAIRAPATKTDRIQEYHVHLYHCLCEMLEIHFFGRPPAERSRHGEAQGLQFTPDQVT